MTAGGLSESAGESLAAASLRPNFVLVCAGTSLAALLSFTFLAWPVALASTVLIALMIAGAEVDARTLLLPDIVTLGGTGCGLLAAALLEPADPWSSLGAAAARAVATALLLASLREAHRRLRGHEGLGLGDVKLAAAIGAWLPLAAIPTCFALATTAALVSLLLGRRRQPLDELRLPFGAFLCPALWLVFFVESLPR